MEKTEHCLTLEEFAKTFGMSMKEVRQSVEDGIIHTVDRNGQVVVIVEWVPECGYLTLKEFAEIMGTSVKEVRKETEDDGVLATELIKGKQVIPFEAAANRICLGCDPLPTVRIRAQRLSDALEKKGVDPSPHMHTVKVWLGEEESDTQKEERLAKLAKLQSIREMIAGTLECHPGQKHLALTLEGIDKQIAALRGGSVGAA